MDLSNFIKSEEGVVEFEKLPTPGLSAESINLSSNHERRPEFQPEQATRVRIPKILIVDDEESNIRLLKAMLLSENYKLIDVLSGKAALKAVNDFDPDLILLDVMMPQIDGFEVCRILKQDEKTRKIPVIIVTALNEKKHRIKAMEVGADDFLSKPVDRPELLVRVKSLLRIKAYHDELLDSLRIIAGKNDQASKTGKN